MGIQKLGVVGAGAWGTALAQSMCYTSCDVMLWAHEKETATEINERNLNTTFLPEIPLNSKIQATSDLEEFRDCDVILLVAPAQFLRKISLDLKNILRPDCPVLICSKGIEIDSLKLMSQILEETMPGSPLAILSGPSFAHEVATNLPSALTLACSDEKLGLELINTLGHTTMRLYWTDDIIGAQIGGAIKNVMAIASGISSGKNLGQNAHAALTTRGFVELVEIGKAFGGRPETLTGLSGLGDLILTCSSPKSRNMSLGHALGQGQTVQEILGGRKSVTEGVYTAEAVAKISREKDLELPISNAVHQILQGNLSVDLAIEALLSRPFKPEAY